MNREWEIKKLGDISEIIYGYTEKASFKEIGPKFLRITDIQNNNVDWESVPFCSANGSDYQKYKLNDGDIVFARTGATTGKSYLIKNSPKSVFASYLIKVHLNNGDLLPEFLYLYFQTNKYWETINSGIAGSAQGGFNATKLSQMRIPIPPIPEQKRIVKILDEAFAAIDKAKVNAEKNLQNSRELFDSYLNKVFANPGEDWKECFLDDHIKFIDYRGRTPEKTTHGMRLITAKNIKNGYLQKEPEEFVNPNIYDSWMTRGIPKKGDVLFTTEAPLANVAQLDTDEKVVFAQRTIIFQPDPKIFNQSFLKYLLLSKPIKTRIIEKGTGATVKGIKAKLLKQIPIYFPQSLDKQERSLDKQERIVDKLNNLSDEIKKLKVTYQQKLADLEELKKSILQKAFEGEL